MAHFLENISVQTSDTGLLLPTKAREEFKSVSSTTPDYSVQALEFSVVRECFLTLAERDIRSDDLIVQFAARS